MTEEKLLPVHPGEILSEDFLKPMGISAYRLAKAINVPRNRITGILKGTRGISSDTALRLSKFFGTTAKLWMNLQVAYDLETEAEKLGELPDVVPLKNVV